ncbi:hypothetical protein TIFTF001_028701 [Ficus carica]|uniref:Uncharacterized protein n=1 Tax=Ficus carica TaxID=3494 RepID=A0AA88DQK1_FICCA|nr:hypothetical protein TIFTF001_028701 [Ficus carica]
MDNGLISAPIATAHCLADPDISSIFVLGSSRVQENCTVGDREGGGEVKIMNEEIGGLGHGGGRGMGSRGPSSVAVGGRKPNQSARATAGAGGGGGGPPPPSFSGGGGGCVWDPTTGSNPGDGAEEVGDHAFEVRLLKTQTSMADPPSPSCRL